MAGAAADFVQAQVPGDGEKPSGEFGRNLVTMGRLVDLKENMLGQVFRLGRVGKGPISQVHHGLFVFLH